MREMAAHDYLHQIEYRSGHDLVHSEVVSDHGWYIKTGEDWRVRYTTACAAEWLRGRPGAWVVIVWRLGEDGSRGDCVCSIKISSTR